MIHRAASFYQIYNIAMVSSMPKNVVHIQVYKTIMMWIHLWN